MKTLLVTGGCGFIGSHFVKRFLTTHPDWRVVNLDKLTYSGNLANTRELEGNPRYEFVRGDVCDASCVDSVVARAAAVVHFAAETHVDRSIENADDFLTTNILGTRVLIEAARTHKIERFIHISTDEVYGSVSEGAVNEEAPLFPNSPYSASKAAADLLIRSYGVTYHYPAVIVRSSNNFGPYQYPEKVIPLFITNLIQKKKVPLYGAGANRREWIYVEDNCAAIELIFERGEEAEIYNVSAGNEMSNLDLARRILKAMNFQEEMIEYVTDRPGHDYRYSVDATRLRRLGFKPQWTFEEALKKTIEWYRAHEDWWLPLKRDKFTLK
jgi:dTDP-glucose 4,6-dehydratase